MAGQPAALPGNFADGSDGGAKLPRPTQRPSVFCPMPGTRAAYLRFLGDPETFVGQSRHLHNSVLLPSDKQWRLGRQAESNRRQGREFGQGSAEQAGRK